MTRLSPSPLSLSTDPAFFALLAHSYRRLLGKPLAPDSVPADQQAAWLYEAAPFGILAHDTAADPVFVYGNRRAQAIFGYDWHELTTLPSRLSAEAPERSERQAFLERVTRHGYVDDYRGIRIAKSGERFWIENVTVWQLTDADGRYHGQAALLPNVTPIGTAADTR
ncbi:MEKHLA domain-containing protein [Burkholderia glumae]|uniref:MEKHLA domain-containing protein n=1 Tax=Burkholderia glumae TaxID=337 RepID=UPI0002E1422E|nr:MEKHLA domain-containing protein [Burkholderia glumae]MCQ0030963.1 MEKHLA domain-containing protein [Burkholderia glumae]MCQ0037774.1 MEKHLA domain-containing protein [Burkholderia glumae]PJO22501.1 MEKHLA domain-containing protein [Burkholderia glumae AU6208]QHE13684.1 MEKHLA domain-containing protein [Burkholderia glumae AU6208]RQZ71476.1 MEKHLA domain-containing protein [Burkholderia glumae]